MKSIIKPGFILFATLLISISSISRDKQRQSSNLALLLLTAKKPTAGHVALIDKLLVPKNSIDEYRKQGNTIGKFIRTLPGLISQQAFEQKDPEGNITVITIAIWENQEALNMAREAVQAEFKRINFDPGFFNRLNIKIERSVYNTIENQ
ncbi:MAG TPA: hypothetical protein VF939_11980 [Puia sp.]